MDLWERGPHEGRVWDAKAEGGTREGRAASGGEEEEEAISRRYHDTVLSGKLRQAACWATNREGGGCLLPDDQCTKTGQPIAEVLQEKHPDMHISPVENPACVAFKEYGEVPETVPLDFTESDMTLVASKLSGNTGYLGAEAIDLINWILRFRCASEELRVVVARLADWMANFSPPWDTYHSLMACRLVALDKRPGVRPVGIAETLRRSLAKLAMRAVGDQANTVCGNLQLYTGLETGVEGTTHAVGQRQLERARTIRSAEVAGSPDKEEDSECVDTALTHFRIKIAGT